MFVPLIAVNEIHNLLGKNLQATYNNLCDSIHSKYENENQYREKSLGTKNKKKWKLLRATVKLYFTHLLGGVSVQRTKLEMQQF